jgi:hypothetical protein
MACVELDASTTASGAKVYSLPDEQTAQPRVAYTALAHASIVAWVSRLLADRCAMRAQLQIANGGKADPDPVCVRTDK